MSTTKRPRLKIPLKPIDVWMELFSLFLLVTITGYAIISFDSLPDVIPTHFNGKGVPDAFGDKTSLFSPIILLTLLFAGLTLLNRFPHLFNYMGKITKENALHQYTLATRMVRLLKLSVLLIFGFITYSQIQTATSNTSTLGGWVLPFVLITIFAPLFGYFFYSFKDPKSKN
jgi:uncharacterized membrane protein